MKRIDRQRLERFQTPSYERQRVLRQSRRAAANPAGEVTIECGWGRLLIAPTFADPQALARALLEERPGARDIALYVAEPHVVLALAPQELFLDPSDTLRLWFTDYRPSPRAFRGFSIRRAQRPSDWEAINAIYAARGMVQVEPQRLGGPEEDSSPVYWVAADAVDGTVIGTVMSLGHFRAFGDAEHGSSLWCLAVAPGTSRVSVGEALLRHVIEYNASRSCAYLDLSVLHDNAEAKALYRKLGFRPLRSFALKRRNGINQALFLGPDPAAAMNPYARIIIAEARRRGIAVEVDDAAGGLFTLTLGARRLRCRESLSDLCSAVSMTLCQDKTLTRRALERAGLTVPSGRLAGSAQENAAFLAEHGALVVKPVDGEQGQGVAVDLRSSEALEAAIAAARQFDSRVLLERYCPGDDLRIVVIGYAVVAAAIRRPAEITGDGVHDIRRLIERRSRRRMAATGGESRIPLDAETERYVREQGHDYAEVLAPGVTLRVRRTANLHTGGVLEDVTEQLHPVLAEAAVTAARTLEIPVVGLDLLVPAANRPEHVFIEANERPGLANHEPQPTAQRFIDLLFPLSRRAAYPETLP